MTSTIHTSPPILNNVIDARNCRGGFILSHSGINDEEKYDNNINSSLKIININHQQFTLGFLSLQLHIHEDDEREGICSDYLTIYHGNEVESLCKAEPNEIFPQDRVIFAEEVLLTFVTDDRHRDKGFVLHFKGK